MRYSDSKEYYQSIYLFLRSDWYPIFIIPGILSIISCKNCLFSPINGLLYIPNFFSTFFALILLFFEFCCVSIDRRKYKYQKVKGECDFIIECKNSIIIIEAKKKVLTIKSKSEQNYNIFMDLSTSLLKSQIQAGKVEFLLKKNGKIILKENKREHEILLGGQNNKKDFLNTIRILFFT